MPADPRRDGPPDPAEALKKGLGDEAAARTAEAVAQQMQDVGDQVASLFAEAARQVTISPGAFRDPIENIRRIQRQLDQARETFRRTQDLFGAQRRPAPAPADQDRSYGTGPKDQATPTPATFTAPESGPATVTGGAAPPPDTLESLPGLDPVSAARLRALGVTTASALRRLTSLEEGRRVLAAASGLAIEDLARWGAG